MLHRSILFCAVISIWTHDIHFCAAERIQRRTFLFHTILMLLNVLLHTRNILLPEICHETSAEPKAL